jgi:Spy/CpxP family protein refolding chaperone
VAKLVVIIGFVIAFAAGLTVGLATRTTGLAGLAPHAPGATATTRPSGGRGARFLIDALDLTPQQAQQLSRIWSAAPGPHEFDERRSQIRHERDDAILALVPASDRARYDQVQQIYKEQIESVNHELRASFDQKVAQTREILTPEQQSRYDAILKQHQAERESRGRGGSFSNGPGRRGDDHATSRPAAASNPEAQ